MVLTLEEKKERKRISNKKYKEKNKDKIKEYYKEYQKMNPHIYVISKWKHHGIIHDDYDKLYKYYMSINNCQVCNKEFNKDIVMDRKCLDHDHETGLFRCVCCGDCNIHNRMIIPDQSQLYDLP